MYCSRKAKVDLGSCETLLSSTFLTPLSLERLPPFRNPFLYNLGASGLNDITDGANCGCGIAPAFSANVGWDPVTGNGVFSYFVFLK